MLWGGDSGGEPSLALTNVKIATGAGAVKIATGAEGCNMLSSWKI